MSATFQFCESNLAGEVVTDGITNLNFGGEDSVNLNVSNHPIVRGQSSFEKYIRAKFSSTFTEISNMLFWKSAGALVTGEVIKAATNQAFATPSVTANGDSAVPTTSATALTLQSAEGAATILTIISGISGYTKYVRLQTDSTVSTPTGSANQKTFTFQYDEV
jgi:hypothetical protein